MEGQPVSKDCKIHKDGYTIVTQDESHFKDACNVCKILGKTVPTHIHVVEWGTS